ncbi:BrnT family toxin [Aliikangiella maris]|uniref:BrnT family toxin n=2 Tax=Aliikangiella maris TaxID=3162458 RepID=A0ABV2BNG8_9GAMM
MNFEWDENKNQTNIRKHGIDFRAASKVFKDANFIVSEDTRYDYDENRFQIIGAVDPHGVLVVIYTECYEDTIRLISARKADKRERRLYQQSNSW